MSIFVSIHCVVVVDFQTTPFQTQRGKFLSISPTRNRSRCAVHDLLRPLAAGTTHVTHGNYVNSDSCVTGRCRLSIALNF